MNGIFHFNTTTTIKQKCNNSVNISLLLELKLQINHFTLFTINPYILSGNLNQFEDQQQEIFYKVFLEGRGQTVKVSENIHKNIKINHIATINQNERIIFQQFFGYLIYSFIPQQHYQRFVMEIEDANIVQRQKLIIEFDSSIINIFWKDQFVFQTLLNQLVEDSNDSTQYSLLRITLCDNLWSMKTINPFLSQLIELIIPNLTLQCSQNKIQYDNYQQMIKIIYNISNLRIQNSVYCEFKNPEQCMIQQCNFYYQFKQAVTFVFLKNIILVRIQNKHNVNDC
ncbi:unnamed protein product [Paramecium octaurelia]|uniref:Uncharacterized protein n=1 Tax=Paramecium octaurelia TaxID=43137 RepID=A0A8S1WIE9_PAROT|nr:unnamed protein product [Paramecium octaurelia]